MANTREFLLFTDCTMANPNGDMINENRDLIYFVEKDIDNATSSCRRADKYGLHKNQSLYNAYKIGRLGAKPSLGSPFILND